MATRISYVISTESVDIRESVDSLCRDGADMPISLNIQNCLKLQNVAVIRLFRHITWSRSSFVPDNSLKIIRYSDTRKTAKMPISPSSSSSSVTTKLAQVLTFISAQNNCFLVCACSQTKRFFVGPFRTIKTRSYNSTSV